MSRVVSLVLALVLLVAPMALAADDFTSGLLDGQQAAEANYKSGYIAGPFIGGLLAGIIGVGVSWAVAANSSPSLDTGAQVFINGKSSDYQRGFYEGYNRVARQKNVNTALVSSGAGWLTWIIIYSATMSSSRYYSSAHTMPMLQVAF